MYIHKNILITVLKAKIKVQLKEGGGVHTPNLFSPVMAQHIPPSISQPQPQPQPQPQTQQPQFQTSPQSKAPIIEQTPLRNPTKEFELLQEIENLKEQLEIHKSELEAKKKAALSSYQEKETANAKILELQKDLFDLRQQALKANKVYHAQCSITNIISF